MSRRSFERTGGDVGVEVRRGSLAAAHMEVGAVMVSLSVSGPLRCLTGFLLEPRCRAWEGGPCLGPLGLL